MPFDGFAVAAAAAELNQILAKGRIDKIHQPEKDELVFTIRLAQGSIRLQISANARWARIHTTETRRPNPANPPSFCMLLRKYLEGGKILSVRQVDFERIIHIDIEALDDFREWTTKRLICEFMGRHSNIILVHPEQNVIIDAIKRYGSDVSSYREVLPGKTYIDPPTQNKVSPLESSYEQFTQLMWAEDEAADLSNALFHRYTGVSPFAAREICLMEGLSPNLPVAQCGEYEFSKIYEAVRRLADEASRGISYPSVIYRLGVPQEFSAYPLASGDVRRFDTMNQACDRFYTQKLDYLRLESWKTNLGRDIKTVLDKAYKKRFFQEGDIHQATEHEKFKTWGELITAYAYQLEKGMLEAHLEDYQRGGEVVVPLDPRYTPIQNAQKYFKVYNKSRKTLVHLSSLMAENQAEIDYLESVLVSIQQAESTGDMEDIADELEKGKPGKDKRKKGTGTGPRSTPRRFISSDGLEILVGRNNRQNDNLTLKTSDPGDLWLHTKNIPGTHVIIRLPRTMKTIHDVPDATLEEAALLAGHFSKARESEKVEVDYTFRSQVRKPGGAKPGMVIYDNYWTLVVNPREDRVEKLLTSEIKPQ